MASAQISTLLIYGTVRNVPLNDAEIQSMAITALGAVVAGLLGARSLHFLFDLNPSERLQDRNAATSVDCGLSHDQNTTLETTKPETADTSVTRMTTVFNNYNCTRSGISIQAAVLSIIIFMLFTDTLEPSLSKPDLIAAMSLSLTLGEGIGRVGCFSAGCCGSRTDNGREFCRGLQIMASLMNFAIFALISNLFYNSSLGLQESGALALMLNAMVRLLTDPVRESGESEQIPSTTAFAFGQMILSFGLLVTTRLSAETLSVTVISSASLAVLSFLALWAFRSIWSALGRSKLFKAEMSLFFRPITGVAAFGLAIIILTVKDTIGFPGIKGVSLEMGTMGHNPWTILSNPTVLATLATTALIPILTGPNGVSHCGVFVKGE
ncbi:hypothetical protein B0I35DRAFT_427716 [Stachybotrys elegans]|uniref:Uncharacterized protein n=1 Tax=Stachybotrys elegans TaxID=80388 RepID=A0A8K0STR8_9HYPO|nr:hypothetical protein B0I35DRAFT_427716 [Stachybotrys elegans]